MASHRRSKTPPVDQILAGEADEFEFHAFIKLLEELNPKAAPVGVQSDPLKEVVNFKTHVGFDFPPTDIRSFSTAEFPDTPPNLTTDFFAIAGHPGPLPTPYTQRLIDSDRRGDTAMHSFLDIFNHRFLSLLHRIRKKYWVGVSSEDAEHTFLGRCLRSLLGMGLPSLVNRMPILDRSFFPYVGLIWGSHRSLEGLEKIVSSFFRLPVSITQFEGKWQDVPLSQQSSLGRGGKFNILGKTAILGDRFWDQQALIAFHIGPMTLAQYVEFLKPGKSYDALCQLVVYYAGKGQDFTINPILKKDEIPKTKLGYGVALSWTSWLNQLNKEPFGNDDQNTMNTDPFKKTIKAKKKPLK